MYYPAGIWQYRRYLGREKSYVSVSRIPFTIPLQSLTASGYSVPPLHIRSVVCICNILITCLRLYLGSSSWSTLTSFYLASYFTILIFLF